METSGNFLKTSLDKTLIYTTPEKLLVWIKLKSLIGNPEFKSKVENIKKYLSIDTNESNLIIKLKLMRKIDKQIKEVIDNL